MYKIEEIKKPIKKNLKIFDVKLKESLNSSSSLLKNINNYIFSHRGKQIRPMFVFFSSGLCGEINETTYKIAIGIELIHNASLMHDDVVDESNFRRNNYSVNALWKNKVAVLVGDFFLCKGMTSYLDSNNFELLKILSASVAEMSEGELLQIEKNRNLTSINEDIYFRIIQKKTASLISASCACGYASSSSDKKNIDILKDFGNNAGIIFQMKDDILDYEKNNCSGKPFGLDLKDKQITLPLIYLLNNSNYSDRKKIINIINNHNNEPEYINFIINKVKDCGGIEYAKTKMKTYQDKALKLLNKFPESIARQSLEKLIYFIAERDY